MTTKATTEAEVERACALREKALTLRSQGQYQQAESAALEALAVLERVEGASHPDVANVLNSLAAIQIDLGKYTQAERLARRSVAIMEPLDGDGDLARLRVQSLNQLATAYRIQGLYD